jgi:hypothetical protein
MNANATTTAQAVATRYSNVVMMVFPFTYQHASAMPNYKLLIRKKRATKTCQKVTRSVRM